jgi:hypothetical protein
LQGKSADRHSRPAVIELTAHQLADFARDGFLIIANVIPPKHAAAVAQRFEGLFKGQSKPASIPTNGIASIRTWFAASYRGLP